MRMTKIAKLTISFALILCLVLTSVITVSACTGFYLGKDLTENGSTIWGRSEDISANYSKLYVVRPAATHAPGEMFVGGDGFVYPYPEKTLRYTIVRDSTFNENYVNDPYGEVGMNEKNVALTATVTISGGKTAITGSSGIDPMVSARNGGISEMTMTSIILMQATSARHAVEVLADAIDTYGSAGREAITISDPNEVWYMEILSGHQYVAVKAPSNKVGVSPNITMMGAVDVTDTENVIASPGLVSIAKQAGTQVTDANGWIKVADSYANSVTVNTRLYDGISYLKGKAYADSLTNGYFHYFMDGRPGEKYSLYEAMRLTAYGANSRTATVEANVFETRHNRPDELAIVEWLAMGPAIYSVYLPYYGSLITDTYGPYWNADSRTFNGNSFYWVFRQLNTRCSSNPERYGKNVIKFWENYQKKLIEQQKDIDDIMVSVLDYSRELAEEKATELGKAVAKEAFENAKIILAELQAFIDAGTAGDFTPSLLTQNVLPNYTFDAIGGAGLPTMTVANGKQVTVPITLNDCTNFSGLEGGVVKYDSDLLTLVDIAGANGFTLTRNGNSFNVATGDMNRSGDVVIGYAIFTAKENLDDDYTTYVTFPKDKMAAYNNLTEEIDVNPLAVQITVLSEPLLLGDVDLNGTISVADAILLLQYLSQNNTLTAKQLRAANVVQDGLVNTADAVVIMQMCL